MHVISSFILEVSEKYSITKQSYSGHLHKGVFEKIPDVYVHKILPKMTKSLTHKPT